MKITIESTTKCVLLMIEAPFHMGPVPARIWEGTTSTGIPIHAFITRIAVDKEADCAQFDRELSECRSPENPDISAYPMKLIL